MGRNPEAAGGPGASSQHRHLLARHQPKGADPRLSRVTVEQLLTMTSGLAGDDPGLAGDERLLTAIGQSRDWVRHILSRRLATTPGTRFAYSNAGFHLLSAIVADATGQSTLAFARTRLFGPLGIHSDHAFEPLAGGRFPTPAQVQAYHQAAVAWPRDPQGYHFGSGEMKLSARDLAKLGYLYLNGGRWDGTQVVPADYVRASIQPHRTFEADSRYGYGYGWWTLSVNGHASWATPSSALRERSTSSRWSGLARAPIVMPSVPGSTDDDLGQPLAGGRTDVVHELARHERPADGRAFLARLHGHLGDQLLDEQLELGRARGGVGPSTEQLSESASALKRTESDPQLVM